MLQVNPIMLCMIRNSCYRLLKLHKNFLLKNRYQNILESMKGSAFVFDYLHLLYYKCHKTNLNRGGSYIDAPEWVKNKKATINLINNEDSKCF